MIITIDKMTPDPIYLQIRNQIVAAIARGWLEPGDSLPSVRSLAADLGVNLHTVNKAYAVLQDEGYVIMAGRSGTIVTEQGVSPNQEQLKDFEEKTLTSLKQLALEYKARGGNPDSFISLAQQAVQDWKDDCHD